METVQNRLVFHGAPSGQRVGAERSNTVYAEHYWDYINEAWDEPNFSKRSKDAGAIGVNRFWDHEHDCVRRAGLDFRFITALRRLTKIADFLIKKIVTVSIRICVMAAPARPVFDRLDDGADIVETST